MAQPAQLHTDNIRNINTSSGNCDFESGSFIRIRWRWQHLSYFTQHLLLLLTVPFLFLLPWLAGILFNFHSSIIWIFPLEEWSRIFFISCILFLSISLIVRMSIDLAIYFGRLKYAYQISLIYNTQKQIIYILFFSTILILIDHYIPLQCHEPPIPDSYLVIFVNSQSTKCQLKVLRKIISCIIMSIVGSTLIKWLILTISLHYQDKIYRERLLYNDYKIYLCENLLEGAKEEEIKHGIELSSFQTSKFPNVTIDSKKFQKHKETESPKSDHSRQHEEESEDEMEESIYSSVTPKIPKSTAFMNKIIGFFQRKNQPSATGILKSTPSAELRRDWSIVPDTNKSILNQLRDFNSFKKIYKIKQQSVSVLHHGGHDGIDPDETKNKARYIFEALRQSSDPAKDYLTLNDLNGLVDNKLIATEIFEIFDTNLDGRITRSEFKQNFNFIHKERYFLAASIHSSMEALKVLESVLISGICIGLLILFAAIFGMNVQSLLTLCLSVILAVSGLFGEVTRDLFDCLIFLFVIHPYDIGDKVRLDRNPNVYTVKQIHVLRTEFLAQSGELLYISNTSLIHANIANLRRSTEEWEIMDLHLDLSTTEKQLSEFKIGMSLYLEKNKSYFYPKLEIEIYPNNESLLNNYSIRVRVKCKPSLESTRKVERVRLLTYHIKRELERLQISYFPNGSLGPGVVAIKEIMAKRSSRSTSIFREGPTQKPKILTQIQ